MCQELHQPVVVDIVKETFDVDLDDPVGSDSTVRLMLATRRDNRVSAENRRSLQ